MEWLWYVRGANNGLLDPYMNEHAYSSVLKMTHLTRFYRSVVYHKLYLSVQDVLTAFLEEVSSRGNIGVDNWQVTLIKIECIQYAIIRMRK